VVRRASRGGAGKEPGPLEIDPLGVTELCERYGKVIVLEDDTAVSSHFLEFMNELPGPLRERRSGDADFGLFLSISAPVRHDAFFLVHGVCWGWGTWKRAWQHFGVDEAEHRRIAEDRSYRRKFNVDDAYPYSRMLLRQRRGEIDSWGVIWYAGIRAKG